MNEEIVIQWLQRNWLAFILAFIPPLIAEMKGRPKTRWYLYGLACTLVAWPLVSLPTTPLTTELLGHAVPSSKKEDVYSRNVRAARTRAGGRSDELWYQPERGLSPSRRLCREDSQGGEAGGLARGAVEQIEVPPNLSAEADEIIE
jgi:hypothetical protein